RFDLTVTKYLHARSSPGWGHDQPPPPEKEVLIVEVTPDANGHAEIKIGDHRVVLEIAIADEQ
ncbi:MAG TPA: hypothetical protein VJA27_00990, partial [Patescibacteria group bacterium]|nr:hypothetical protein [Patescibacteria group bacterium]